MNKSVYTSEKGTHNMLLAARLLVRVVSGMEIAGAFLFLIVPVIVIGVDDEFTILLILVGVGLILHGIIGLVVASFMTWYISTKQIIYLIISGILLLLPTLIEGFHFNLFFCFSCFLYIYAAVRCIKHNKKAQEEVREEREREEALNNE
ncbi:hypothetical protein E3303_04735 [Listeria monocytogenes]|uniref:hypothetical protein n=2 Tax=Listeria monocytogenes TaxID=1639 RepID=UPI00098E825F|nr:hypothetical protein [Listeria monocytogenes]EAD1641508.1 hypothetical protein [Listeria monocytogenes]EAD1644361.1 hypothetical protein [Listeria monocytogenes]EAD1659715.1 hypothetical protein [Listeria monocytogenes]EAE6033777.1 hypothetical protein [Listeria monocytogenes]EAG2075761.1 hypothetical protein [Listeria monocytogenes]